MHISFYKAKHIFQHLFETVSENDPKNEEKTRNSKQINSLYNALNLLRKWDLFDLACIKNRLCFYL